MEMLLVLGIAFTLSLIPAIFVLARTYGRFRGTRLVYCPIAKKIVEMRLDAAHAAWTSATGEPNLRVASCSEWPARKDCAADCLIRLEISPAARQSLA